MAKDADPSNAEDVVASKIPTLDDTINGLVTAMSSVFTSIATESLGSDGSINVAQIPAFLEKTASMLKDMSKPAESNDASPAPAPADDNNDQTQAAAPAETKSDGTSDLVFVDEWKLAISKSTGKVLGIFPDNALAQRWYSAEAEEEIASKNALSSYDSAVQRCREQVETIIKECRRTNTKFRDPDFSLEEHETCLYSLDSNKNEYPFPPKGFAQTRKIFKKPQFYVDGATASDVKQGQAGDCWFLAGIAALTNFKACLTQNYVSVDGDEKVGVYGFVFHRDGEWIYEIVDDFLYTKHPRHGHLLKHFKQDSPEYYMLGKLTEEKYNRTFAEGGDALFFAQSRDENETWLPLMEKAFAKCHGDYWSIDGGFTGEAIEDLTGGITTEMRTEDILDPDVLWDELLLCNEQFIFGCWTPEWDHGDLFNQGLCSGHAYSIMKAVGADINGETERLLLVRNPWGKSEWTGPYSDGSKEMDAALLTQLGHTTGDDGMFYMSFDDFLRKFELLDRTRLVGNDWQLAQVWTNVKIPRTKTYLDTKFLFTIDRADTVVMSLSQLDDRYIRGLMGQYYFDLEFRLERDGAEHAGHVIARSSQWINTFRSINAEVYLEAGQYNVFVKVTAHYVGGRSVKDSVKYYIENNKVKLIQIAKKYNFAHMKQGVGDKEDRIFESLTVEQDAEKEVEEKDGDKSKDDTDQPSETPSDAAAAPADTPGPDPSAAPEIPVENPVTEEPKPALAPTPKPTPTSEDKKEEKQKKEKKDKSIENWNPVATIGLRLFTRKAKVALSIVRDAKETTEIPKSSSAKKAGTDAATPAGPTILISVESTKIGNVPPIGDPLPTTPQPQASKVTTEPTSAVEPLDLDAGTVIPADTTSKPLAMADSTVKEGAEKAEDVKSPEEKDSGKPVSENKKSSTVTSQVAEQTISSPEEGDEQEKLATRSKSSTESSEPVATPLTGSISGSETAETQPRAPATEVGVDKSS